MFALAFLGLGKNQDWGTQNVLQGDMIHQQSAKIPLLNLSTYEALQGDRTHPQCAKTLLLNLHT